MGLIRGIYVALLQGWIHLGERIFPPTIHPMLVHFPIVLLYLALLADLLSRAIHSTDHFFDRASFWLLALGLVAGVCTAAAGVVSEQFVRWTPTTKVMLYAHQRDAVITGGLVMLTLAARLYARYPRRGYSRHSEGWSFAGSRRGKASWLATVLLVASVAMITTTASLGGTMVYQYGVGIKHVTFRSPVVLRSWR